MKVMSKSTLIVVALALSLLSMLEPKAQIAQSSERDLSRYDKIGPLNVPVMGTDVNSVSAKIRGFIWNHWEQRRLGYAVVTFHSKEGEPSTSHMFVEPDENGVWHLSVRIERELIDRRGWSDPKYRGKKFNRTDSYKAYAIERVMDKDSYRLRFKGEDRKVIIVW
jgi:hypothetical protein